ncbi:MAG: hypothetical protein PUP92_36765 [Rhizonema sp. PD38]|nr:hypothetical protein [Rhizonema sp. PD38]
MKNTVYLATRLLISYLIASSVGGSNGKTRFFEFAYLQSEKIGGMQSYSVKFHPTNPWHVEPADFETAANCFGNPKQFDEKRDLQW